MRPLVAGVWDSFMSRGITFFTSYSRQPKIKNRAVGCQRNATEELFSQSSASGNICSETAESTGDRSTLVVCCLVGQLVFTKEVLELQVAITCSLFPDIP
jgi:hypothetical protein